MTKPKDKTSDQFPDSTPASRPDKPAVPTITTVSTKSVSVKQQAQKTKPNVFIHEAKPTLH